MVPSRQPSHVKSLTAYPNPCKAPLTAPLGGVRKAKKEIDPSVVKNVVFRPRSDLRPLGVERHNTAVRIATGVVPVKFRRPRGPRWQLRSLRRLASAVPPPRPAVRLGVALSNRFRVLWYLSLLTFLVIAPALVLVLYPQTQALLKVQLVRLRSVLLDTLVVVMAQLLPKAQGPHSQKFCLQRT